MKPKRRKHKPKRRHPTTPTKSAADVAANILTRGKPPDTETLDEANKVVETWATTKAKERRANDAPPPRLIFPDWWKRHRNPTIEELNPQDTTKDTTNESEEPCQQKPNEPQRSK